MSKVHKKSKGWLQKGDDARVVVIEAVEEPAKAE